MKKDQDLMIFARDLTKSEHLKDSVPFYQVKLSKQPKYESQKQFNLKQQVAHKKIQRFIQPKVLDIPNFETNFQDIQGNSEDKQKPNSNVSCEVQESTSNFQNFNETNQNKSIQIRKMNQCFSQVQRQYMQNLIQNSKLGYAKSCMVRINNPISNLKNNNKTDETKQQQQQQQTTKYILEVMRQIQKDQSEKNQLLGGGGCYSHAQQVQPPRILHKKLDKSNLNLIQSLKKDSYFQQDVNKQGKNQVLDQKQSKRENFNTHYEAYFTNEKVDEDEIETHVRLIVEEAIFRYREKIVLQEIRYKVIDLINLVINYLLVVIQKNESQSLQQDIEELDKKLKTLQKYCLENRKRYPCMDLYYYMEILISLNLQRQGLDRVNQSAISKIAEKIIQVAKFGAGFVSIAGAITNLTKINFDDMKKFIQEVKEIFAQIAQSSQQVIPTASDAMVSNSQGSLFNQICALWIRKLEAIGENILDTHQEIIFYLEERDKLQNKEIILFVYMQLNYLLTKQQKIDDLQGLTKELVKLKKQNLVTDFANELQLKQYQSGILDYIKNLANLIAFNEQFRYLKASLLQKIALIIHNLGNKKQEYQSIMVDLCLNYIQEKEISVKIVYKGNQKMKEFIDNIDKYYQEILSESKQLNSQMTKFVEDKQQISQISNNIETEKDIPKLLAINFVQMWEIGVKQRLDQHKIAHKDDALLEAINLYVKQSFSHQDGHNFIEKENHKNGNKSIGNENEFKSNDALKCIIDNFLIPNFVKFTKDNEQSESNKSCKILSILAEGGSATYVFYLYVALKKAVPQDERAQYIPLIIKCNSLELENPSIEKYLKSQNLRENEIDILKKSERNKLLLLDGYDEYTGNYFKVFKELKIYDWVNTIIIVTSRLEKITVSDAKNYFSYYDKNGQKGDESSFSVVKLEKITHSDIKEYLEKFKMQMQQSSQGLSQDDYKVASDIIFQNKNLIELLKLPINLYLTTRMMVDLNLKDENVLKTLKLATDQIEIQELFFEEQFQKQSQHFVEQFELKDKESKEELILRVKSSYFEYFQNIAMDMFCQKGKKQNFLSSSKASINYQLREEVKKSLKTNKVKEQILTSRLMNYIDSRVITRIKLSSEAENEDKQKDNNIEDQEMQNIDEDQNSEFEFRHKSIFEYFAARAMKFDFDIHKEKIHQLPLKQLEKFNINQKIIMHVGYNKSEQQILLKLFKLIDNDKQIEYTQNYLQNEIEKNNRYIQYIKRSQINRYDQVSPIDIGSSNLLSALFISKFSFENISLSQCSLSKFYNIGNKTCNINFDQCNLNHALLKKIKIRSVESSYTEQSVFDSVQQIFSTQDCYNFTQIVFEQNTLISVNNLGFINKLSIKKNQSNQFKIDQSKKITYSPLRFLKMYSKNQALVSAKVTLFLINIYDLQVHKLKKFEKKKTSVDCCINQIIVQLKNQKTYFGNFETGFNEIVVKGKDAKFSQNSEFVASINQNQLLIYNKKDQSFIELKNINAHTLDITTVAFSHDKKYLASSSEDKDCKIWSLEKGFELVTTLQGHSKSVTSILFSTDGKYLATISQDKTCKVWNILKGFELIKTLQNEETILNSISFSADGKYLAASSANQLTIWNLEKELEIIDNIKGHTDQITQVAFSGKGKYLATRAKDNTCMIWNAEDRFKLAKIIQGYYPTDILFALNDKYFAMISENTCQIFDQQKYFELIHTIQGISQQYQLIAFSPNSKYFATSSEDNTCKIWNVEQGFQFVQKIESNSHLLTASFSADSKHLAITFNEKQNELYLYNAEKQFELLSSLKIQDKNIESVSFSANGKYLATNLSDCSVLIYNLEKGFQIVNTIKSERYQISQMAFSADSKYFATCSLDCKIWNVENGYELINTIRFQDYGYSIAFCPLGNYLATASNEEACQVWQTEKLFESLNKIESHNSRIISLDFSTDCKYLATSSDGNCCKIWDIQNRFQLIKTIQGIEDNNTYSVAFSIDNKYLAVGYFNYCGIYDVDQGFKQINLLQANGSTLSLSFSSDGKYLAGGSIDRSCKVWDVEKDFLQIKDKDLWNYETVTSTAFSADSKYLATGNSVCDIMILNAVSEFDLITTVTHSKRITSVNFSSDGKYLATSSLDKTCKVWDPQNNFELVKQIQEHSKQLTSVVFSDNSQYILTSSFDKTCKIWKTNQNFELFTTIKCPRGINKMSFSKDGKYLATCQDDNSCIIWNVQNLFLNDNSIEENNQASVSLKDSNIKQVNQASIQQYYCEYVL